MRASVAPLTRAGRTLVERRWYAVGALVLVQWLVLWHEALHRVQHNGWLYQNGDDGPWYWTSAWTLSSLHLPYTSVGPGWPLVLSPFAAIFGPVMTDGLPAVIALNMLVLAPAAVVGMYLLGERIAGRVFGLWAAALWVVLPVVGVALHRATHRETIVDFFLPTGRGFNALSDFPSAVCAIYAGWLVLRAYDSDRLLDGALAGLVVGYLVLLKPANGPLAAAAVLLLLVTWRLRALAATCVAAVPAAIALAIWKKSGTGSVPALSGGGGGGGKKGGGSTPAVVDNAHRYINIDFHHLAANAHALREIFWSLRVLEFLLVAGTVGLLLRARWRGAFVVAWFALFGLIKGSAPYSNVYDTSLYRFLLPAWPAWVLIVGGVVFCWPTGAAARVRAAAETRARAAATVPVRRELVAGAAVLLAAVPLCTIAAASPAAPGKVVDQNYVGSPVAAVDFGLKDTRTDDHTIRLTWRPRTTHASTTYVVFKAGDQGCVFATRTLCRFKMQYIGQTRTPAFVDDQATSHRFYRIGLAIGTRAQRDNPALLLVSTPLEVPAP